MENAAKALTMAGGILISIMIISAAVLMYNQITKVPNEQENNRRIEQIAEFNNQFETYNRKGLYGSDIISIINKIQNNNKKYTDLGEDAYIMELEVVLTVIDEVFCPLGRKTSYTLQTLNAKIEEAKSIQNEDPSNPYYHPYTDFKRKMFKCTNVDYDKYTGIIRKMRFEQIDLSQQS